MRIVYVWWIIAVSLILVGCSSEESSFRAGYDFSKVDKVAVVAVEGTVKGEPAKDQIAEFFAMELLKKGYAPVGRIQVKKLLQEQELPSAVLTTVEGAAQAGQILNVPVVLVVNIPYFGEEISMTAVMIDVADGSFLWMGSSSGRTEVTLSTIFGTGPEAGAVAGSESDQVFGGIVGEPVGMTKQALTLSEAKRVQKIVKRVCKRLPYHAGPKKAKRWLF